MSFTNLLNIDTSVMAIAGHFGNKMREYGECHIGSPIWLLNGLTLQDKIRFEAYQTACEEEDLISITQYEEETPPEMRDNIINTIVEINKWYGIGNGQMEKEEEEEENNKQ